ncbi:MAG: TolC family protein [Bacteroidales bacterium]|nr:TolC family protein [Bacteroidales bacterium]
MSLLFRLTTKVPEMIRFLVLTILICFITGKVSFTQEVYDLSHCIKTGLEHNFALQVVRNQEQITNNNFTAGNAGMLPSVSASNNFGGSVNNSHQNYRDGNELISEGVHNYSNIAGIGLDMTIFRGFQVKNMYDKLGKQGELGTLNTQLAIENLVSQIVAEYNNYIQQLSQYENLAYAVSLSRERVRIDEQRYLLGSASKLELLQSLVYLNADSSRYARQNEVLRTSQIKLNKLMSSGHLGDNIVLQDSSIIMDETLIYEELLDQTLLNNTHLLIASKNKTVAELDYKIIKSRSYPYLAMSTDYGLSYYNYGAGDMSNQNIFGFSYGLTLGINIFDGLNRRREAANARIEIENRNIGYLDVEQEIKADLLTIYYAYQNNLRLLRLEEQNLEVARENLEIALERYKLGSLSGLELREVQKSLLDAEERLISVKYLTKLAEISLKKISGKIMDYL